MNLTRRRIVYIDGCGYGNYQIQKQKKGWFGKKYWKATHLCTSMKEAERLLAYLQSLPDEGDVLYETEN